MKEKRGSNDILISSTRQEKRIETIISIKGKKKERMKKDKEDVN